MATKDKDIELWKSWKKTRHPNELQPLLKQMDGIIQKETNRWQGAVARDVLEIEATRLAKSAFETYDPKMGAALSTHLTNTLQKLSREVYSNQNLARMPEYQTLKIKQFERARTELEGTLGREPSAAELANHLAWSQAAVDALRKQLRKENVESNDLKGLPSFGPSEGDGIVHLVYHDLSPTQKVIFEHKVGYAGAPVLPAKDIMKKLNLSQGQLSYELDKIKAQFKKAQK